MTVVCGKDLQFILTFVTIQCKFYKLKIDFFEKCSVSFSNLL